MKGTDHMMYLAIIPSVILLIVIWRNDKIEKEPAGLLLKLFLFGALTTISAMLIGIAADGVVLAFLAKESIIYALLDNFIFTALVEEGGKYFVLKKTTWKHPAFNYTFDGVVYAVVASLGFATIENILYLVDGDVVTAVMRGVLSVPGHAIDGVFMGCYYGIAKYLDASGDVKGSKNNLRKALLVPTLLHGFYDFCLSTEYEILLLAFLIFEIVITVVCIKKIKKLSKQDTYIPGSVPPQMSRSQQANVQQQYAQGQQPYSQPQQYGQGQQMNTPQQMYGQAPRQPYVQPQQQYGQMQQPYSQPQQMNSRPPYGQPYTQNGTLAQNRLAPNPGNNIPEDQSQFKG